MTNKTFVLSALFLLALPSAVYCMDGILARYELPNATVEQFESLQQAWDGICGACVIVNAVAIDDILRHSGPDALIPCNVQYQASQYPETTINAYANLYRNGEPGLAMDEILTYARSHGLENVLFMFADLTLWDINGLVSANELREQISRCDSVVVYFICHELGRDIDHAVLNVLIKQPGHRARIIFMDPGNIPLDNYPQAQAQAALISCLI